MKATWNGEVIAESNHTIVIENNHYFPKESVKATFLSDSPTHTTCHWKGEASYYNLNVAGAINEDAAWYYPNPLPDSLKIVGKDFSNFIAFWRGVEASE